MENQNQLFKFVVVIAALFALLYVAILLSNTTSKNRNGEQAVDQAQLPVQTTPLPEDKLSSKFPSNLPIEANAEITQNSESKSDEGAQQGTRVFISQKTSTENLALYEAWMKANGWDVLSKMDEAGIKMVLGKKAYQLLQATVTENADKKTTTVTLTVTEQ